MSLTDELKKMKRKGRQVVSIDYVLNSLRESQRDDCENCKQIYNTEIKRLKTDIESFNGVKGVI